MNAKFFLVCFTMISSLLTIQTLSAQVTVSITVDPGTNWESRVWMGIMPINKTPQLAAWVETENGEYVGTLLVTGRSASGQWRGAPEGGRPDSLPVWYHAAGISATTAKKETNAEVDAASSATPTGKDAVQGRPIVLESGKVYIIRLEINHSFDYNDHWKKKAARGESGYSGVNGQPSLVYECRVLAGQYETVPMKAIGTGSVDGADGRIDTGTNSLTTALTIIEGAKVRRQKI